MILVIPNALLAQSSWRETIAFEGVLTDSNSNPVDLSGKFLHFYIGNAANTCYAYHETSITAGGSDGSIYHRVGTGSQVSGFYNSYIFSGVVSGTVDGESAGIFCSIGSIEGRMLKIYSPDYNISLSVPLSAVPYALDAKSLDGYSANSFFINFYANPTVAQTNLNTVLSPSGSANQVLSTDGWGNISWSTPAAAPTALPPTGTAGGDLSGTYPNPVVANIQGVSVINTAPTDGQILKYDGAQSKYVPNFIKLPELMAGNQAGTTAFPTTNCGAAKTLTYDSTNQKYTCTNISITKSQVSDLGTIGTLASKNTVDLGSVDAIGTLAPARMPALSGDLSSSVGSTIVDVIGLRGISISTTPPTSTGHVLKFDGVDTWVPAFISESKWGQDSVNIYYDSGSVKIGHNNTAMGSDLAKLDVQGSIAASGTIISRGISNASGATTIDFSTGNNQYINDGCKAYTLSGLKDGGSYQLALQGSTAGTCSFVPPAGFTIRAGPANLDKSPSTHMLISFTVMGNFIYVSTINGY